MVSSTILSASSGQTKIRKAKMSKNPGLSLHIVRSQSEQFSVVHSSTYNSEIKDEVQYVLIPHDSPFYKSALAPRTSAYLSFTGFAFACDALAEEDSLLTKTPHELLDEELQRRMPSSEPRHKKKAKMPMNPDLLLNLTRELSHPSQRVVVRRRPGTANSFTNTPGLEPSSDADSDSDFENDEDTQFVYIPANSPFNTAPSTTRTASAYLPLSAIPFACDALAEEDPLFAKSPSDLFDDELQFSMPSSNEKGGVIVEIYDDAEEELLITREWVSARGDPVKPVSIRLNSGENVLQQYL